MRKDLKSSKYYGVTWNKKDKKWKLTITIEGERTYIGSYDSEEEAARKYDELVKIYYGNRAKLNFPVIPFNPIPGTRLIQLTYGKWATVSEEDYEWLNIYNWHAQYYEENDTWYALRSRTKGEKGSGRIAMHREVLGITDPKEMADHIDHDGLHNHRPNVRKCTNSGNQRNQRVRKGCTSKYKGVCWHKLRKKWHAMIFLDGKLTFLGGSHDEKVCARRYNMAAIYFYEEHACINTEEELPELYQYDLSV